MSRAAVYSLLSTDTELAALGGTGWVVVPNFTADQRPNDKGAFVVIRWGDTDFDKGLAGPHHFDLWVHIPVAVSTDYVRIDAILDRVDEIFEAANDASQVGGDGRTLDLIIPEGRSGDFKDQGYQTICRRASYKALSHQTT